jgi:hypothetical protein
MKVLHLIKVQALVSIVDKLSETERSVASRRMESLDTQLFASLEFFPELSFHTVIKSVLFETNNFCVEFNTYISS